MRRAFVALATAVATLGMFAVISGSVASARSAEPGVASACDRDPWWYANVWQSRDAGLGNMVLDIAGPSTAHGASIHLWSHYCGLSQQWYREHVPGTNNGFYLRSAYSGMYMWSSSIWGGTVFQAGRPDPVHHYWWDFALWRREDAGTFRGWTTRRWLNVGATRYWGQAMYLNAGAPLGLGALLTTWPLNGRTNQHWF